jgi:hypothetical protein
MLVNFSLVNWKAIQREGTTCENTCRSLPAVSLPGLLASGLGVLLSAQHRTVKKSASMLF